MIRLRTLGTLDLRNSDGSELRGIITQTRRLALLAYLAVANPRGFHRRDRLLTLFWSDHPTERARASLSRAIYFLRSELGQEILLSRGDEEVGLDHERFWCDAAALEDALQHRRSREALELYHGDILPGFFVSNAQEFEQWLESERARLKERASVAAWTLAAENEKAGNLGEAAQWARRGLELSPFREVGLRHLLALLDRAGDRVHAGRVYQEFEDQIAAELELSPSPETRALIAAIRSRDRPNGLSEAVINETDTERLSARDVPPRATPSSPPPARADGGRRIALLAAAAVVLASSAVVVARVSRTGREPGRVFVVPFEASTGDRALAAVGRVAADRIIQSLASTGLVEVVAPGASGVSDPGETTGHSAAATLGASRAGTVVSGALHRETGRIHVQAWIADPRRHRVVWAVPPVSAPADSAERAIDEVSRRVAGAVAALTMPRFASWFPTASSPPTFGAFQEFALAVEQQARGADRGAVKHLQRAVALDPTFTWAELQLAAAYLSLFDSEHADPMTEALDRERELLNPLQRHWLEWMLAMKEEDLTGGYQAISAAAEIAPQRFLFDVARWTTFLNRPRGLAYGLARLGRAPDREADLLGDEGEAPPA